MARTKSTARKTTPINYIGFNKLRKLNLLNKVIESNGLATTTSTTTIEELKNYLLLSFGLFLEYNIYQRNNNISENLDVIELVSQERIIEKLEKINEISNVKDKEQQLIRLAIQEGANWLIHSVYFEYLECYNGDIIIPTQSSNPNTKFNSSLWSYTQFYYSVDGLKYLINVKFFENNTRKYTPNSLNIRSSTPKDQFLQFLTLYYNQTDINFGSTFIDGALFQIISGNIIGGTSLEAMLELFKIVGDLLPTKDTIDSNISKAFKEYIKLFDQSRNLYDINGEKIQDLKLPPLPLDKYKWLIGHCKANMSPIDYVYVNPFFMCIDSKELVDFILENKEFYQLVPANILLIPRYKKNLLETTEVDIPSYQYTTELPEVPKSYNFGSFQIAQYFQDKLYKIYDSFSTLSENIKKKDAQLDGESTTIPTLTIPYLNDRHSIYKSLFLKSILNCDIQEINHFIGLVPSLNIGRDVIGAVVVQTYRRAFNFPKFQKETFSIVERDQILQSKFYNDQETRNTFLNHLNNNNFKCFTFSTFDYLKRSITITLKETLEDSTDTSTSTTSTTSPIIEFKFENQYSNFIFNSFLSMGYLLNSIYKLNFKSVEMILNLPNFNISISDIETIIMNESTQFSYDITRGTFQSKFKYQDIKEMLLLLIKVLPLPESNLSIQYIYFHLYKCLLQSIGIEMYHLIEIHNIYNSIGITNQMLFNNNQIFHLFYWVHLKSKKLSNVLTNSDKFGRGIDTLISMWGYQGNTEKFDAISRQFDVTQPQLQFDFIYNCNDLKTILVAFTRKKPLKSKDQIVDIDSKSEYPEEEEEDQDEKEENLDDNLLISQQFGLYILVIGELDIYLEITNKSEDGCFEDLEFSDSILIADSDKLEEFISFDKVGKGITWFIEGAIEGERIDIIEKLFSIYPTETIESFNQKDNLESFLDYHSTSFLKYMFENHYSITYNHFKTELENPNNNPSTTGKKRKCRGLDFFFVGVEKNGYEYSELLLKHIPQLFKFTPSLILSLLESGRFTIVQYYYEIGTIQIQDFSNKSVNLLKSNDDLKYLKWVIDL